MESAFFTDDDDAEAKDQKRKLHKLDRQLKVRANTVRHLVARDPLAADGKLTLFASAVFSYRYQSVARPLPREYDRPGGIHGLTEALDAAPALRSLLDGGPAAQLAPPPTLGLLLWLLTPPQTPGSTGAALRALPRPTSAPTSAAPTPDYLFEVENPILEEKWQNRAERKKIIVAFLGQPLDAFHSIVHRGVLITSDAVPLKRSLADALESSTPGYGLGSSELGARLRCVAECQCVVEVPGLLAVDNDLLLVDGQLAHVSRLYLYKVAEDADTGPELCDTRMFTTSQTHDFDTAHLPEFRFEVETTPTSQWLAQVERGDKLFEYHESFGPRLDKRSPPQQPSLPPSSGDHTLSDSIPELEKSDTDQPVDVDLRQMMEELINTNLDNSWPTEEDIELANDMEKLMKLREVGKRDSFLNECRDYILSMAEARLFRSESTPPPQIPPESLEADETEDEIIQATATPEEKKSLSQDDICYDETTMRSDTDQPVDVDPRQMMEELINTNLDNSWPTDSLLDECRDYILRMAEARLLGSESTSLPQISPESLASDETEDETLQGTAMPAEKRTLSQDDGTTMRSDTEEPVSVDPRQMMTELIHTNLDDYWPTEEDVEMMRNDARDSILDDYRDYLFRMAEARLLGSESTPPPSEMPPEPIWADETENEPLQSTALSVENKSLPEAFFNNDETIISPISSGGFSETEDTEGEEEDEKEKKNLYSQVRPLEPLKVSATPKKHSRKDGSGKDSGISARSTSGSVKKCTCAPEEETHPTCDPHKSSMKRIKKSQPPPGDQSYSLQEPSEPIIQTEDESHPTSDSLTSSTRKSSNKRIKTAKESQSPSGLETASPRESSGPSNPQLMALSPSEQENIEREAVKLQEMLDSQMSSGSSSPTSFMKFSDLGETLQDENSDGEESEIGSKRKDLPDKDDGPLSAQEADESVRSMVSITSSNSEEIQREFEETLIEPIFHSQVQRDRRGRRLLILLLHSTPSSRH